MIPQGVRTDVTERERDACMLTSPQHAEELMLRAESERNISNCAFIHCMNDGCEQWAIEATYFCSPECRASFEAQRKQ